MSYPIYEPKHFKPEELVDPSLYKLFEKHPEIIYNLFDPDLLMWADWMRDTYGAMLINNWKTGGTRKWSGYRHPLSPDYSDGSMHSLAKALDLKPLDMSAQAIIADLKKKGSEVPYIKRIEDKPDMTWIHGDTSPLVYKVRPYFFKV